MLALSLRGAERRSNLDPGAHCPTRLLRGVYPRAAQSADPWARNDSHSIGFDQPDLVSAAARPRSSTPFCLGSRLLSLGAGVAVSGDVRRFRARRELRLGSLLARCRPVHDTFSGLVQDPRPPPDGGQDRLAGTPNTRDTASSRPPRYSKFLIGLESSVVPAKAGTQNLPRA